MAHLAGGQADILARGVQEGMGAAGPQGVEGRGSCLADGVVGLILTPAPSIEDDEHHRASFLHEGNLYERGLHGATWQSAAPYLAGNGGRFNI